MPYEITVHMVGEEPFTIFENLSILDNSFIGELIDELSNEWDFVIISRKRDGDDEI